MNSLIDTDTAHVVRRIPKDVRDLLSKYAGTLFLGGGFIRSILAGEPVSDIDMFGTSKEHLEVIAKELQRARGGKEHCRLHHTKNAITVVSIGRHTIQLITRWTFDSPEKVAESFDFTVCQAVISRAGTAKKDGWKSCVSDRFYIDLAARRIVYTAPIRDEDAGGSLLRSIKYVRKGYSLQVEALAGVVARLTGAVDQARLREGSPDELRMIYSGLLREVDPLIVVDGLEITDDHETPNADFGLPEETPL